MSYLHSTSPLRGQTDTMSGIGVFVTRRRTVQANATTRAMAKQARWEQSPADAREFNPEHRSTFGDYSRMAARPADSAAARRATETITTAIRRDARSHYTDRAVEVEPTVRPKDELAERRMKGYTA